MSDAAAAFAADSGLRDDPVALRRAAYLHAVPDSATFDPERALQLLTESRALARRGRLSLADARLQGVLRQMVRDRQVRADRERLLRAMLVQAEMEAREARVARGRLAGVVTAGETERAELLARIAALEQQLREHAAQIATLMHELDRLKAIDLSPSSRSSPPIPPPVPPRIAPD
jgi:hypothetical protein